MTLRDAGVELFDCEHRTPPAREAGYPYIAIPQLKEGRVDVRDARRITREHLEEWTRRAKPSSHDVILSRRCNPGVTAVVPEALECALGQNLVLLRADGSRIYPPFLRWLVRGPAWWEQVGKFLNVGAVFDSLRCADVPRFELPVPPLSEQRAIAAILGALDDKIDLNRRMNETLEAMARAIFKSWFVDFDPVRAKMEGRAPVGMDAETAALFPNRMAESELGEVPEGWSIRPLDEIAHFLNGLALQKYPPRGRATLPVIKIAEMKNGVSAKTDTADAAIPAQYVLRDGDVLFSWSGSLAVVVWTGGEGALNQHLFKVTSTSVPKWFYLGWLRHHLPSFQAIAAAKATTMGHIQRHHLTHAKTVGAPKTLLDVADRTMAPLLSAQVHRALEIRTLASLRDFLLPRLLSGDIRVRDAERIAEAVL